MRIGSLSAVSAVAIALVCTLSPAFAHGGEETNGADALDSLLETGDSFEDRAQGLSSLDEVIPPEERAAIDARRAEDARSLDALLARAKRGAAVDLRYRDTPVKKQFGGTCTTFGLLAAMENLSAGQGDRVELSPKHFWSQYRKYSCSVAIKTATRGYGVVEMDWWPSQNCRPYRGYRNQPWYKLTEQEPLGADIPRALASLDEGNPVYIGLSTPVDLMNCSTHVDPGTKQYKKSGHALAVVGYALDPSIPGGGEFLLKNSWGTKCGDHGYQWYPFNLCSKKGMYCAFWSIKGVVHD